MDLDGFRSFILDSGIDVWTWIDMAITVASADHENELKKRRDGIIQKLYVPTFTMCQNCDHRKTECGAYEQQKQDSGIDCEIQGKDLDGIEEAEEDDEEQKRILEIRVRLDDQNQSEKSLIDLLQGLVDMDISFKALKETDIGRHVTKLRKHSSGEVRRLVKILVRKWKDTVDEWVRLNTPPEESTECIADDNKSPSNPSYYSTTPSKLSLKRSETDQRHQESQHGKKQRSAVEMTEFHSNNGVPIKYW